MSNTSARMAADASGHIYSAANIKKEIPTGELQMYDRMDAESCVSYGSTIQASENLFSPSVIKELPKTYDEEAPEEEGAADEEAKELGKEGREEENEEEKEEKDQEDIHNVYEIEHEKSFNELYLAADRDDTEAVRRLLMSSVDVNVLDANKTTRSQLYATVKGLLNKKASVDTRSTPDIHGENDSLKPHWEQQLCLAAKNGHADVVDALLERGICNFEMSFDYYETPLQVAVKERHTKVVEVILKHRCKTYEKLTEDEQKLQETYGNLTEEEDSMLVELEKSDGRCVFAELVLTEIYTPIEMMRGFSGSTALELAVKSTHPKMVKILVNYDRFAYTEDHLVKSFQYMIHSIMMSNSVHDIVSNIKHRNTIDIMEIMCYDMQYRMKCNYIKEIAHVFMNSSKFNVNNQDDELNTPLHRATQKCLNCSYGYLTTRLRWRLLQIQTIDYVVQLLLKKGANFNMKNTFGETPLIIASEKGCCHIIQILFDWEQKSGMKLDVDARDQFGATALIKAAEKNHVSVMRLLLNHKVSVNLHDYYGFTALHAAIYAPNRTYFDLHFLCKNLRKRKLYCLHDVWSTIGEKVINPLKTSVLMQENLETDKKTIRCKEEMVKLLLALDETNVNFTDFRGNTPLDLAVKSSKRITSETFKALKNRGAIQSLLESKDEAPIQLARIDERGRNPLHRLVISQISNYAAEEIKAVKTELDDERLMVDGILLKPENFRQSATATDGKGRTPLHCASMSSDISIQGRDLARILLQIGSNVNAADIYGKTPLHYAETYYQHKLLIEYGAEENKKDKSGHTPRDLRQLRESVTANIDNVQKSLIGKKPLCTYRCIGQLLSTVQVTKLSKQKLVETIRIYSQSPRPKESPEEAIWQVWIQDDFLRLNIRISQLRPSIQRLIERLVDGIKERDPRFECQPILVGSADEETKAVISAD